MRRMIFGCLSYASMLTSLLISSIKSGVMLGLKIFFTATSHPLYLPVYTMLNPPKVVKNVYHKITYDTNNNINIFFFVIF